MNEQDNTAIELRKKIEGYWHKSMCEWADSNYSIVCNCYVIISQLIQQHTEAAVREARIAENKGHLKIVNDKFGDNDPLTLPFIVRIDELKEGKL